MRAFWKKRNKISDYADYLLQFLQGDVTNGVISWCRKIDFAENDKEYIVTAEIPGVKKKDISVELHDGVLKLILKKQAVNRAKNKTVKKPNVKKKSVKKKPAKKS